MRSHVFPLAIISLFNPICFVALQTPHSTQGAALASASRQMQDGVRKEVPEACPVTKPPAQPFVPPPPYWTDHGTDAFWFGTRKLWILLPNNGTWHVLPIDSQGQIAHAARDITAYSQKLAWYREGYDWRSDPQREQPMMKVTGERQGAPAPPLAAHANTVTARPPYIMVGVDIPTLGCWKITGHFEDTELSFVVWVVV